MRLLISLSLCLLLISCNNNSKNQKLVWEENFDGDSLSPKHWNYEVGDGCPNLCGWGNNERQIYSEDYVRVKNGNLIITANKIGDTYYSGKVNTKDKFEFQYGILEARAKVPKGYGLWPAIWMLGENLDEVGWPAAGEIDVMEFLGRQTDTIHTSLHTPAGNGDFASTKHTEVKNVTEDFHVYKIDWSKDAIVFYIDDEKVYTFSPAIKNDKTYPYNHPFYLLINMAVGGNFGGPEVDDNIFPKEFLIDYIRVYEN